MKQFRNLSIKTKSGLVLLAILLVLICEFFILRWKVSQLEEVHYQESFARKSLFSCQEIYINTLLRKTNDDLSTIILADLDKHAYNLEKLGHGGRLGESTIFVGSLPRLSAISFDELAKHWKSFQQTVKNTVSEDIDATSLPAKWLTVSSWYNKLIEDLDETVKARRSGLTTWLVTFVIIDILLFLGIYLGFTKDVFSRLITIRNNTSNYKKSKFDSLDEISTLSSSINGVIEELKDATDFIQQIGEGNLAINYTDLDPEYEPGKNTLADSLIEMQGKLKEINMEERKRSWSNEGFTKFVEILRSGNNDLTSLGDNIMSTLVQYTESNQGGLYLLNDDNENNIHLELIALFAFDTKKYNKQQIKLGEGILGQTFLEQKTTYLAKVPSEYMSITSGLGGANPKSVLVVPLKIDDTVYGVVELASFRAFQDHEIAFVEKLGENIASSLANVKAAQKNKKLLDESREAQENMRSQEEEMRQNMEELAATQEEIARKEQDYVAKISQLEAELKQHNPEELEQLRAVLEATQRESETKIQELQEEIKSLPSSDKQWQIAQDVEKTLRINLEALRITQEALKGQNPAY